MSLSNRIAKNTLIQILGKVVSTALGLFSLGLITRYLGQSGYGEYTTVINFLTIFAVLADFGLTLVTVQMISGVPKGEKENKILNNLFTFRLVTIVLFLALSPIILYFIPYSAVVKVGILITAPSFIFPALTQIIVGLLQKRLKMGRAVVAEVSSRVVLIIGVVLAWYLKAGLNGILLATLISGASSFILHYALARNLAQFKLSWDFIFWKKILKQSWPLAITIVLNLLYLRTDIIFLSFYKSSAEVGIYGAAYRVIDVLTTIPFMFAGLILPILTMSWIDKKKNYFKKTLQRAFDFMIIIALPLLVGGVMLAKPIMLAVAGEEFIASGKILALLIVAVAAIFAGTMFSHAVIAIDKQKKLIGFYIFTSITALIGYVTLIPLYAGVGAALVTIYSEVIIACFSAYCVYKYARFLPNIKTASKSLIASLVMGLFLYLYPDTLSLGFLNISTTIILAALVYGLFLFLLGGISVEDIQILFKKNKIHKAVVEVDKV